MKLKLYPKLLSLYLCAHYLERKRLSLYFCA